MKRRWYWILSILLVLISAGYYVYQRSIIFGVVSDGQQRLGDAVVRIQATTHSTTTGPDGIFRLWMPFSKDSVFVTAWKDKYFINGETARRGDKLVHIKLRTFLQQDNFAYKWVRPHPDPANEMACANCHEEIYKEWAGSTHARTSQNEKVIQMYWGTDADGNPNVPPGVQLDQPGTHLSCGGCHMPTAAIEYGDAYVVQPGDKLTGADLDGVHCDFCHKIVEAYPNPSGNPGSLSVDVMRPFENSAFPQLFVGSLDDVVGRDTYLPLYTKSIYCSPCHHHVEDNNGMLVYSSYIEWKNSDYAREGIECQQCHMKPSGKMTNFAPPRPGIRRVGVERDPMTIPTHHTPGVHDSTFLASAVDMQVETDITDGQLTVEVRITNVNAGHHVPTDTPDRNMLLLVEARSGSGPLPLETGGRLPDYAGAGNDPNDYAGRPGRGFSKLLVDSTSSTIPVPWWRIGARVHEDTRIPARKTDVSRYIFALQGAAGPVTVQATLYFRKTYKAWADAKKWDQEDQIMARVERTLDTGTLAANRSQQRVR